MRRATTVVELLIVLVIVAALAGVVVPRAGRFMDRTQVHGAATELRALLAVARDAAVFRGAVVAVSLDEARSAVAVAQSADTIRVIDLQRSRGVRLHTTRDSVAYGPTGLGYGSANATIILERGRAAETVYVSRLGRVRR